jgi:hypothetical protein
VLLEGPRATVIHGTDPGDFYCEHMFYLAQREAARAGTSLARNSEGEPLVGFLHFPDDPYSGGGRTYTQEQRHAGAREVVGAALRGYFEEAAAADRKGPVKVLLTGYDTFMSIRDNPTGDFVRHPENLDAALAAAFGADLLSPRGEVVQGRAAPGGGARTRADGGGAAATGGAPSGGSAPAGTAAGGGGVGDDGGVTLRFRVRDPITGRPRALEVRLERFAVSDDTLDPAKPGSFQRAARAFAPHAILSMGIAGGTAFKAEHHADDGGLRSSGRAFVHDDARRAESAHPDNYSLARAIARGSRPAPAPRGAGIT